jgi:hypothetical protein
MDEFISELVYISAGLILLRHSIESGDVPTNTIVEALDAQRTHLDRIVSDWEMKQEALALFNRKKETT